MMETLDLFHINDVLDALAEQYGVRASYVDHEKYYEWLNDLTHHVAIEMGYQPPNLQKVV